MSTDTIINDVVSTTPDVVKDAFSPARGAELKELTLGDALQLESAGCDFFLRSGAPSMREMIILWCFFYDREAFAASVQSGGLAAYLATKNEVATSEVFARLQRDVLPVVIRSFNPAAGGGDAGKCRSRASDGGSL